MREISKSNNLVLAVQSPTDCSMLRQVLVFRASLGMPENARLDDPAPGTSSTWREIAKRYIIETGYNGDRVLRYKMPDYFEALRAKARQQRLREKRKARKRPPLKPIDPASRLLRRRKKGEVI